jgi:hypothetical protein
LRLLSFSVIAEGILRAETGSNDLVHLVQVGLGFLGL